MSAHRHLDEHELLDLLLEGGAAREAAARCPTCSEALRDLDGFLGQCRAAAATADARPEASQRLAELVLARTTREDLGWRGDLRLLRGFVGQRLRSSAVLRFAAASLLVHLLALPVLAWFAFREAPREYAIQVDFDFPREQMLPDVPAEPERSPQMPGPEPEPRLVEADLAAGPERASAVRAAERAFLTSVAVPALSGDGDGGALERLLHARSARLGEGRLATFLARGTPPETAGALESALWAEVLLDHLVLAGERLPGLDTALKRLSAAPGAGPHAERALVARTLRRALGCGLLGAEGSRRVQAQLSELGLPRAGGVEDAAGWSSALEQALAGTSAEGSAAARAWSGWGR
jgi:hypothetical protein